MTEIKDLALALAYLSIDRNYDPVDQVFSQEEKDLFADWFLENWQDGWDAELVNVQINKIGAKIDELKQIKG